MPNQAQVLFAPAAGEGVGGGHIVRCLALALALRDRGVECVFAVPEAGGAVLQRFAPATIGVHELSSTLDPGARTEDLRAAMLSLRPRALVLDNYGLDARHEAALRPDLELLAVLDDLADRPHLADLLIDSAYGRMAGDYTQWLPPECELLIGPRYALLRPEFNDATPLTRDRIRQVFVSFGLSDVGGIAARSLAALAPNLGEIDVDVAIAGDAASLAEVLRLAAANPRIAVHVDARDVASLMRRADVAVGAGGSTTWERFSLGLPTLAVIVAENQRPTIEALARDGLILAVDAGQPDLQAALVQGFDRLRDPALRRRLGQASRAVCDGGGAARVAEAIAARLAPV